MEKREGLNCQMNLKKLLTQVASSMLVQLVVTGVAIVFLMYGPMGHVFRYAGIFSSDSPVSHDFDRVAEALESGQSSGVGYDPYLGPTGRRPSLSNEPSEDSGGMFDEDSAIGKVLRAIGFGKRAVEAPEWVPLFPGSIDKGTIRQSVHEGEKTIIRAAVPATGDSVARFYERAFAQIGYSFTKQQKGSETTFNADSPDGARTVTVAINSLGTRSMLTLTHLERSNLAASRAVATPAE